MPVLQLKLKPEAEPDIRYPTRINASAIRAHFFSPSVHCLLNAETVSYVWTDGGNHDSSHDQKRELSDGAL